MITPTVSEVIDYLRDNLTVQVEVTKSYEYGSGESQVVRTTVKLLIGDEEISSSEDSIAVKE